MANILDYLDWRGDITFAQSPLNEVDNYIFNMLGCPDYSGIVSEEGGEVPLPQAIQSFFDRGGEKKLGLLVSPSLLPMLRRARETPRLAELTFSRFVNRYDPAHPEQFSAMTINVPGGMRVVTYRGTDDTLAGWKEDFLMSVEDAVPAQKDALAYLLRTTSAGPGPLILGGHSKGGNLAVYAAVHAPIEVQDRVEAVYNHDGPGFRSSVRMMPAFERIRSKIFTILPQNSLVGLLLDQGEDHIIVKSPAFGIAAHDGLTWEVKGTRFVRCESFSRGSLAFDKAMAKMESRMDFPARREFVERLFGLLSSTGAVTFADLTENRLRTAIELARALRKASEIRKPMVNALELFLREYVASAAVLLPAIPLRRRRKNPRS